MLITYDPTEAFHDDVVRDAAAAGVTGSPLRATTIEELDRHLSGGRLPWAVLVGPGVGQAACMEVARWLRDRFPDVIILQVAVPTTATLRSALRAGIQDVLSPGSSPAELGEALRLAGYGASGAGGERDGMTVAVFSAKGGVGTSVLASNLALRAQLLTGAETVLVDLDLASADQAVLHGLRPSWTVQDLADGTVGDDPDALDQVLLQIPHSGVRVLAGPLDPAAAESITDTSVLGIVQRLRQLVPLVVVDTASAFTDVTLSVLEHADVIVLPVSLDVLSLRALSVTLQTFDRLQVPRQRLRIVVMRSDAKVGLTLDDVVRTTGTEVDVAVPSSRDVPRSLNTATPLALDAPRCSVVKAVDELVALLTQDVEFDLGDTPARARSGSFGRRRSEPPVRKPIASGGASDDRLAITPADAAPEEASASGVRVAADEASTQSRPRVVRRRSTTADDEAGDASPVASVVALSGSTDRLAAMPPPEPHDADDHQTPDRLSRRRNVRN